jgi:hypothetical protein
MRDGGPHAEKHRTIAWVQNAILKSVKSQQHLNKVIKYARIFMNGKPRNLFLIIIASEILGFTRYIQIATRRQSWRSSMAILHSNKEKCRSHFLTQQKYN